MLKMAILAAMLPPLQGVASESRPGEVSLPAIELSEAWIRALPPSQPVTAAYLSVTNKGEEVVDVTGAKIELAGRVEIHHTREVDGYMRMEKLSQLEVAPGSSLQMMPGGVHLMLFDLERMPSEGESLRLCVTLSTGAGPCTQAEVRKSADTQSHHHHH